MIWWSCYMLGLISNVVQHQFQDKHDVIIKCYRLNRFYAPDSSYVPSIGHKHLCQYKWIKGKFTEPQLIISGQVSQGFPVSSQANGKERKIEEILPENCRKNWRRTINSEIHCWCLHTNTSCNNPLCNKKQKQKSFVTMQSRQSKNRSSLSCLKIGIVDPQNIIATVNHGIWSIMTQGCLSAKCSNT